MAKQRNFRRANRRFEMMIHGGVPESPQSMYQESTYGKTPSRHTGQASDAPGSQIQGGTVSAVFFVRDGVVVGESPTEEQKASPKPESSS